ncbi:MAG TPA: hypothetical protein VHR45_05080 [Thermoanaerobaculia bacterium]|nr:hypothetical protein [Thermoanaerobaculia bacterium]
MRHVIVTRFSVPRLDAATASRHADRRWLDQRLDAFRAYYVPSVERLRVPVVLLCSSASSGYVSARLHGLPWISIVVQDAWHGGWSGSAEDVLTRLDSDDALHEGWFARLEAASAHASKAADPRAAAALTDPGIAADPTDPGIAADPTDPGVADIADVVCTKEFLRLDARSGKIYSYKRNEPSPLAAFRHGANPFAHDHKVLERHYRTECLAGPYLLQVVHGGNLSSRPPAWWRFRRQVPPRRLSAFGLLPA